MPCQPPDEIEDRRVGRLGDRGLRQRDLYDDDEGNEEKNEEPGIGDEDDQPAGAAAACRRLRRRRRAPPLSGCSFAHWRQPPPFLFP